MPQPIKDKVKALEKTNRLITDSLVDAVWVLDAETLKYEYITPSIQKISGYSPEALIDTVVFDRLTPESSENAKTALFEGLKDHESGQQASRSIELERVRKDGGTYWVEVRTHTDSDFTHTICPDGKDIYYPDVKKQS